MEGSSAEVSPWDVEELSSVMRVDWDPEPSVVIDVSDVIELLLESSESWEAELVVGSSLGSRSVDAPEVEAVGDASPDVEDE